MEHDEQESCFAGEAFAREHGRAPTMEEALALVRLLVEVPTGRGRICPDMLGTSAVAILHVATLKDDERERLLVVANERTNACARMAQEHAIRTLGEAAATAIYQAIPYEIRVAGVSDAVHNAARFASQEAVSHARTALGLPAAALSVVKLSR